MSRVIRPSAISFPKSEMRTKQSFKDDVDVNKILRKFTKTGQLPGMIAQDGRYGDFSEVGTFQDALEKVRFAEEQFHALPAHVRKRFGHDPVEFLGFVADPANKQEMADLGLLTKEAMDNLNIRPKGSPITERNHPKSPTNDGIKDDAKAASAAEPSQPGGAS